MLELQASDLKLSIRGSAIVKPEVAENEDGSLQVTYMVRLAGRDPAMLAICHPAAPLHPVEQSAGARHLEGGCP
jgi:hypothetical protein